MPTQEATVVLDPLATAQLVGNLAQALTAQAMQRGRSFLLDRMGQEVAYTRQLHRPRGRPDEANQQKARRRGH
jgi:hypothetical protein